MSVQPLDTPPDWHSRIAQRQAEWRDLRPTAAMLLLHARGEAGPAVLTAMGLEAPAEAPRGVSRGESGGGSGAGGKPAGGDPSGFSDPGAAARNPMVAGIGNPIHGAAASGPRKRTVFGGNLDGVHRIIMAARSQKEFQAWTGVGRDWFGETGNADEITQAMSKPGTAFVRRHHSHDEAWQEWTPPAWRRDKT